MNQQPPLHSAETPITHFPIFRDVILSPEYDRECARIGKQFFRSRDLALSPADLLDIQENLLGLIFEYQQLQDEAHQEFNPIKDMLGKRLVFVVKAVADSIAWRELGFDRFIAKFLTYHNTTGRLNQDSYAELQAAKQLVQANGSRVVLCDISNLRYGDIIEIGNGIPRIIDVKNGSASARDKRAGRQKLENSAINHYFASGRTRLIFPGTKGADYLIYPVNLVPAMLNETHSNLAGLKSALDYARDGAGYVTSMLNQMLGLEVWSVNHLDNIPAVRKVIFPETENTIKHHSLLSAFFETNHQAIFTPTGNFPFDDQTVFELITGKLVYATTLNMDIVMAAYQNSNLHVTPPERSEQDIKDYVRDYALNRTGSELQARLEKEGFFDYLISNGSITLEAKQNHWGTLAADFFSLYTVCASDLYLFEKATMLLRSQQFHFGSTTPDIRYTNESLIWR